MATAFCTRTIERALSLLDENDLTEEVLEIVEHQIELVYRELLCLELTRYLEDVETVELVRGALEELRSLSLPSTSGYEVNIQSDWESSMGRPRYNVQREQLEFLLQTKFTVPQIASLLNVSVRTIRRRMSDYQLSVGNLYSNLSDLELDEIVSRIQLQFGCCGNRQMMGHLWAQRIRVQQSRIRESQRRVDPEGSAMRRLTTI